MRLTPEQLAARKRRNLALAAALVAFIVLVFATTILKLQGNRDEAADGAAARLVVEPD
ncbi:hypothetical protein [uncultured Brevundimonas sp.]|uniref:hypothetical protein n=1 Tax=uncultured Brevundimonas sp. TaxID=213418 RepID=UPI002632F0E7|nr:hypothetical protein [uncultured Brevundimonas sp.]